jgi:hypothetical protein
LRRVGTLQRVNASQIPAGWAAAGYGLPDVCVRHGEPAVERRKVSFSSRPPAWSYFLILVGVLLFVIVALAMRKTVVAPAWPFCARCKELRSRRLKTGLGLLGAAVAALIGSTVVAATVPGDDTVGATILIAGYLLFLAGLVAGLIVVEQSSWRAVATAVLSPDGRWIGVPSPSQAFGERAAAALAQRTVQPQPLR